MTLVEDMQLAHRLADAAADVAMRSFGRATRSESKADGTPVGETDLAVDAVLLGLLQGERPSDAVLSEESGPSGAGTRRWIIDPIDGTVAFLRGAPDWGTHIALEEDGAIVAAVVTRPAMGLRWWAARGGGAFRGRSQGAQLVEIERLRVSTVARLADSRIGGWDVGTEVPAARLRALRGAATWVDLAYNDLLAVLEARADVMVAPGKVWDQAPFVLLLDEAGGSLIDPQGGQRLDLGWVLFTNGCLREELNAAGFFAAQT